MSSSLLSQYFNTTWVKNRENTYSHKVGVFHIVMHNINIITINVIAIITTITIVISITKMTTT